MMGQYVELELMIGYVILNKKIKFINMKFQYIAAFCMTFMCMSCSNKDINTNIPEQLSDISVSEFKSMLTEELQVPSEKSAIFIDENGQEHKVNVSITSRYDDLAQNGLGYAAENHIIEYQNSEINSPIRIQISGNYFKLNETTERVKAQGVSIGYLNGGSPFGINLSYDYSTSSVSSLGSPSVAEYRNYGKVFNNVFEGDKDLGEETAELRFNFDSGIVSFDDEDGRIYVFDRFEG